MHGRVFQIGTMYQHAWSKLRQAFLVASTGLSQTLPCRLLGAGPYSDPPGLSVCPCCPSEVMDVLQEGTLPPVAASTQGRRLQGVLQESSFMPGMQGLQTIAMDQQHEGLSYTTFSA